MIINDETLGQIEQRIIADEGVRDELRSILEERGRETFQDWLNPQKIGARLVSRLEQEGISREAAKAEIAPTIEKYTEKYEAVLAEDKPPVEEPPPAVEQFPPKTRVRTSEGDLGYVLNRYSDTVRSVILDDGEQLQYHIDQLEESEEPPFEHDPR